MLDILLLVLLNFSIVLAQSNCETNDVSITTINLTAIEIITNFSNSSYSISLNCSGCQLYSVDNVSVTIVTGLCPGTLYNVSIDDNELIAQCVIYTGSIENLTIDSINATTARVSWNESFQGGSYIVTYSNSSYGLSGESELDSLEIYSQTNISLIVTHLCPQVLYEFNVTLIVENQQCSSFSVLQQYITNGELTGAVSNFSDNSQINKTAALEVNNDRLILQFYWEPPEIINCPIIQYRITLNQQDSQEQLSSATYNSMSDNKYYNISSNGVAPNTVYTIVVDPVTIAGNGEPLTTSITTPIDVPWDAPQNFQIQYPLPNVQGLIFSWSPPNTPNVPLMELSYNITITREDGSMTSLIYNYPTTSGNITNLNWYERILAYITAFNQKGPGPHSPSDVTYTAQSRSGPVMSLMYSVIGYNSITVSWDTPLNINGILAYYKVMLSYSNSIIQQFFVESGLLRINDIDIKSSYNVTVIPVNGAGDGDQNVIKTYSDELSFLSESISVTRISSNSVELSWTKPSAFKGVIFRYHLEYRPRQLLIGDENTTQVIIQSNQISYVIDGLDPFTLYDIKMTAVTNQGIDTVQLFVYPVSNHNSSNIQGNILQLRMYGSVNCSQNNNLTINLILEGLFKQIMHHCGCNISTAYNNEKLLCNNDDSSIIIRIDNVQAAAIGHILTWLNSPYPIIHINDMVIMLVDTSLACSYFISDIDSDDCIFESVAARSCDGSIAGTFFGAVLFGVILATIIWLMVIFCCFSYKTEETDNSKMQKVKRWMSSISLFRLKRKPTHVYENVTFESKTDIQNLKLNPMPVNSGETLPEINSRFDDIYINEDDIIELRKEEEAKRSGSLEKENAMQVPKLQVVGKEKEAVPTAKGENTKFKLNTNSTPKSRDPVKVHTAAENIKPASISEKGHTKFSSSTGEYMNVQRKPEKPKVTGKKPATHKVTGVKLPPQVKPKPNVVSTGGINLQSNGSYKPSTRDDCNRRIQALLSSKTEYK